MSDLRLEGKLCIISGAAAGIGRETALVQAAALDSAAPAP